MCATGYASAFGFCSQMSKHLRPECVNMALQGIRSFKPVLKGGRGQVFFFGLPLGRVVVSSPRRTALLRVQLSSPNGKPRLTLWRSEFSSASVSTLFTHERQFRGNRGSSGIASQRRSSARWKRAYAELHCQSSASSTKFARTGFRSTYRITVSKCPSV